MKDYDAGNIEYWRQWAVDLEDRRGEVLIILKNGMKVKFKKESKR